MNEPRLSTVYDLAGLRLHPDGTRVQQSSRNLRPRVSKVSVRDSRGNWIARDAGGVAAVSKYKKVRDRRVELEEHEDIGLGDYDLDDDESNPRKRSQPKNLRPAKRQKFNQDYEFLGSTNTSKVLLHASAQRQCVTTLPPPSSDLLKSIHHFAAHYYTERGQLLDASRQYRKEKKARRLQRQKVTGEEKRSRSRSLVSGSVSEEKDADSEDSAEFSEDDNPDTKEADVKRKKKKTYPKDMYKVLDGSALMAMAIFVQEHVARLLEFHISQGWEETIRTLHDEGFTDDERQGMEIFEAEDNNHERTNNLPEQQGNGNKDDAGSERESTDEDDDNNSSSGDNRADDGDDDDDDKKSRNREQENRRTGVKPDSKITQITQGVS